MEERSGDESSALFENMAIHASADDDLNEIKSSSGPQSMASDITDNSLTLKELQDALASEKAARLAAEEVKAAAFSRFKVFAQEAVKQRDEARMALEESRAALKEVTAARDAAYAEMQSATSVLGSEADKILSALSAAKVKNWNPDGAKGGLSAIVGVLKKRLETSVKALVAERDAALESSEQRSLEMAIESSQLEASVAGWKSKAEDLAKEVESMAVDQEKLLGRLAEREEDLKSARNESMASNARISNLDAALIEITASLSDIWGQTKALSGKLSVQDDALPWLPPSREESPEVKSEQLLHGCRSLLNLISTCQSEKKSQAAEWERSTSTLKRELDLCREEIEKLKSLSGMAEEAWHAELSRELTAVNERLAAAESMSRMFEEKEAAAVDEVAQLRALVSELEEESARWKAAASEEATAGSAVLEDLEGANTQIEMLSAQVLSWKERSEELTMKMKAKDDMAGAAISAREAAEQSLQVAEQRIAELRQSIEQQQAWQPPTARGGGQVSSEQYGEVGCLNAAFPWLMQRSPIGTFQGFRVGGSARVPAVAEMEEMLTEPLM